MNPRLRPLPCILLIALAAGAPSLRAEDTALARLANRSTVTWALRPLPGASSRVVLDLTRTLVSGGAPQGFEVDFTAAAFAEILLPPGAVVTFQPQLLPGHAISAAFRLSPTGGESPEAATLVYELEYDAQDQPQGRLNGYFSRTGEAQGLDFEILNPGPERPEARPRTRCVIL